MDVVFGGDLQRAIGDPRKSWQQVDRPKSPVLRLFLDPVVDDGELVILVCCHQRPHDHDDVESTVLRQAGQVVESARNLPPVALKTPEFSEIVAVVRVKYSGLE